MPRREYSIDPKKENVDDAEEIRFEATPVDDDAADDAAPLLLLAAVVEDGAVAAKRYREVDLTVDSVTPPKIP